MVSWGLSFQDRWRSARAVTFDTVRVHEFFKDNSAVSDGTKDRPSRSSMNSRNTANKAPSYVLNPLMQ